MLKHLSKCIREIKRNVMKNISYKENYIKTSKLLSFLTRNNLQLWNFNLFL